MDKKKVSLPIIRTICIACIGIVFYLLMVFTPLFADDLIYHLIWGTSQPIESVRDIFISLYHHYFQNNGRFVPHFFVQLFDGILGKPLFNIANTVVFLIFILLLLRLDDKREWRLLPVVLVLILALMPGFNNAFLWMSGACNYLWTAVLLLVFYRLMTQSSINPRYSPFLFLFGILCGWTHEGMMIGFLAGCLCYYMIRRKELTWPRAALLVGLIIGTLFLTMAPGSIHRFFQGKEELFSPSIFAHAFFSSFLGMHDLRLLPLLLLILLFFSLFKIIPAGFFYDNLLWFVATGVSFIFVLLTRHQAPQSRFGIELFSLVLILRLLGHITIHRGVLAISGVTVIVILAQTLYYSYQNYQETNRCLAQIQSAETRIIETNEVVCPAFFDRLVLRFKYSEKSDYYACRSIWLDNYYGKKKLLFLPHRFMERIKNDEKAFEEFEIETDLPFYPKRLDTASVNGAVFHLSPPQPGSIPILLRPFADKLERYSAKEVKTTDLTVITLPQGKFVLVMKNHMIADRVDSITLR